MSKAFDDTTERELDVAHIPVGTYVKRKQDAKTVFRRGGYDQCTKRYDLEDAEDMNRTVTVKKGTKLWVGFTY